MLHLLNLSLVEKPRQARNLTLARVAVHHDKLPMAVILTGRLLQLCIGVGPVCVARLRCVLVGASRRG